MQRMILKSAINSFQHISESSFELKPKISGDISTVIQLTAVVIKR